MPRVGCPNIAAGPLRGTFSTLGGDTFLRSLVPSARDHIFRSSRGHVHCQHLPEAIYSLHLHREHCLWSLHNLITKVIIYLHEDLFVCSFDFLPSLLLPVCNYHSLLFLVYTHPHLHLHLTLATLLPHTHHIEVFIAMFYLADLLRDLFLVVSI